MNKRIIENYNDKLSEMYDEATRNEYEWLAPSKIIKALMPLINNDNCILDLGCGTGQSSELFIENGCKVVGVDISSKMLSLAKKHKFWKLSKYDIENGLKGLSFPNKSFDMIIAVGIVEFIRNFEKLIREMTNLTKSEGYISFTYEPVIKNSKLQYKRTSLLGEDIISPIPRLLSFRIYRHTKKEIKEVLSKNNIDIIYQEKFIGYYKTKNKIPIYYEMVIGKKKI